MTALSVWALADEKNKRGNRRAWKTACSPSSGGDGGKTWSWNRIRSPRKEKKNYLINSIKLVLKKY